MEPLNHVLNRPDVKHYLEVERAKARRKAISNFYRKFFLFHSAFAHQWFMHLRALEACRRKGFDITENEFIVMSMVAFAERCIGKQGYLRIDDAYEVTRTYNLMNKNQFNARLKSLRKKGYLIHMRAVDGNKIPHGIKRAIRHRRHSYSRTYLVTRKGFDLIDFFTRSFTYKLADFFRHNPEFTIDYVNSFEFVAKRYFELADTIDQTMTEKLEHIMMKYGEIQLKKKKPRLFKV